jgi:hypothetical protein
MATNQDDNGSAHIPGEHIREDILNAIILEKMVVDDLLPPLLFWDSIFIPTIMCSNQQFTAT